MALAFLPFIGVGELRFGMSPSDIFEVCGPPESTFERYGGGFAETRDDWNFRYLSATGLEEISVGRSKPILFNGLEFVQSGKVAQIFLPLESRPLESLGFLIFPSFGIATTGFHDFDSSQEAITFFKKGGWANLKYVQDYSVK